MKADLHLHTTASDGKVSPRDLVKKAAEQGLTVIAITDHDSVSGIAPALEAAKDYPQCRVIPGVEINTDVPRGEVHILGYFMDYLDPEFNRSLETMRASRYARGLKMVARLQELGVNIKWERVLELAEGGVVGRPHVAQAMLEGGHISTMREAFDKYIGRNAPAYVEREKMTPAAAVELVTRAGGLPVLAHPDGIQNVEPLVHQLKQIGLVGLEAYYGGYMPQTVGMLKKLARKYHLITCGGSDFHGFGDPAGASLGAIDLPQESIEQLFALAESKKGGLVH